MSSVFEKVCIMSSLVFVGGFSAYTIFNPTMEKQTKESIQAKRERILQEKDMRILYSTMTFFYLQGFQQEQPKSFFLLHDILSISKPKIVALQLSEKDYERKYQPVINNPKFPEAMNKIEKILKSKDESSLQQLENDIELKNLEKLYMIDYCKKNKCQLVFADRPQADLINMYSSKLKLQKLAKEEKNIPQELSQLYQESEKIKKESKVFQQDQKDKIATSSAHELRSMSEQDIKDEIFNEYRQNYFVDRIMEELKPKYSFIPSNPYKTIVGIVEPDHVNPIAKKWKNNFRSVYGHEIMEDELIEAKFQEYELGISGKPQENNSNNNQNSAQLNQNKQ